MKILVGFKNPKTGETRHVKCGWSWVLFLWAGFFGLPLFTRKLNVLAFIALLLCLMSLLTSPLGMNIFILQYILICIAFGFQLWLGMRGNELTAKNYLELGWVLVDGSSDVTRLALQQWRIQPDNLPEKSSDNSGRTNPAPVNAQNIQRQAETPIAMVIILTIAFLYVLFALLGAAGVGRGGLSDVNDGASEKVTYSLPPCDSENAKQAVKNAIAHNVYNKLINIEVIGFEEISEVKSPPRTADKAVCKAQIVTNNGRDDITFTMSNSSEPGKFLVEIETNN